MKKEEQHNGCQQAENLRFYGRVQFGMKSLGCLRMDICKITPFDEDDGTEQDFTEYNAALAIIRAKNGKLVFHFLRKTVGTKNAHYFANQKFIVGEDFILSKEVAIKLGLKHATILRGCYTIEIDDRNYTVKMVIKTIEEQIIRDKQYGNV
ncbi:MAG: hypothetical protein HC817_02590 [Saprospiraceae bacterium]|nr:hypothetical protein [Saprospiraceae bacterium]